MKSHKFIIFTLSAVLLALVVLVLVSSHGKAAVTYDYITAFTDSPLCSGAAPEQYSDPAFSELHPGLHGLTDGSDYSYWLNEDGKIEYIRYIDPSEAFPEETQSDYTGADAAQDSAVWFDKVFYSEEASLGDTKNIVTEDFNGGAYTSTIDLIYKGYETGNTASVSMSADGRLISAVFVHSTLAADEIYTEPEISKEKAVETAFEKLIEECHDLYGDEIVLHTDEATEPEVSLKTFNDSRYWEVIFSLPTEHIVDFEEVYDLQCDIRIDAATGECLGISTPLK